MGFRDVGKKSISLLQLTKEAVVGRPGGEEAATADVTGRAGGSMVKK
jgi:hypothetical protein